MPTFKFFRYIRILLCLCGLFLTKLNGYAQNPTDSVTVYISKGIVNGFTGELVKDAKVSISDSIGKVLCDSIPLRYESEMTSAGLWERYSYLIRIPYRSVYNILIEADKYTSFTLSKQPSQRGLIGFVDPIEIFPAPKTKELNEISVVASKVKIVVKGDTIIYNADAFQLSEGSMLDNLIRMLPGATLSESGRITVNGKFVSELLVNGRDFFKGDPKVALANLPAYTVNNIKVYNKAQRLLDGEDENRKATETDPLVMDVNLKREYAKGLISNYEIGGGAGLGSENSVKWLARIFAMRFSPVSSLAVYANANNLNAEQQPGSRGEWSRTDISSGRQTIKSAGIDFSRDYKEEDMKVSTVLTATRRNLLTETASLSETYLDGGNIHSKGNTSNTLNSTDINWKGSFRKYWKYFGITVRPKAGYNHNTSDTESNHILSDKNGVETYSRHQSGWGKANKFDAGMEIDMRYGKRFIPQLNGITMSVRGDYNSVQRNMEDIDRVVYPTGGNKDIDLIQKSALPSYNYSFGATVTPINFQPRFDNDIMMWGNISYSYDHTYQSGKRELMEHNNLELTDAEDFWALDLQNSYHTQEWMDNHTVTLTYILQTPVYLQASVRNEFQLRNIRDERTITNALRRNDYILRARLSGRFGNESDGHSCGFKLRLDQNPPSMLRMLPILDSANPMKLYQGNTNLKKSTDFVSNIYYNFYRNRHNRHVTLSATYDRTYNAITSAQLYNRTTGVFTITPRNIDGNFHTSVSADYSRYVDSRDRFFVSNNLMGTLQRSADYSSANEILNINKVNNWRIWDELQVKASAGPVNLGAKVQFLWTKAISLSDIFMPFSYMDVNYGISAATPTIWGIDLQTDLMAYCRRGYEDSALNTTDWVWNLTLSKAFGRSKAFLVKAIGFDILHNLPNVRQFVDAQGRTETRYNTIPAYAVLSLTYRLDIKPRK